MNTFGNKFRISIFGESHGPLIGVTLDGVLPGIPLGEEDFMEDISRRKSGGTGLRFTIVINRRMYFLFLREDRVFQIEPV